jgi:hypothetical protein
VLVIAGLIIMVSADRAAAGRTEQPEPAGTPSG